MELEKWVSKARLVQLYNIDRAFRRGHNKIKVLKRKAYGYRDDDYFALKILSLHETRYVLLQ